jgi:transcriptional regulator with XRE-family HTH domain
MADSVSENLAANVRRLREEHGLSQQRMADLSGVPRPTWANLESGGANPTVSVLTRVASALGVRVEELLSAPRAELRYFKAGDLGHKKRGKGRLSPLLPQGGRSLEFHRLEFGPDDLWAAAPHSPGTQEILTCELGRIEVSLGSESITLGPGDVAMFRADQRHSYKNLGRRTATAYSVVTVSMIE